jgi:glyoxylase-like metal-dependent hydrolase (beta-lactamase superfamily II)
MTSARSAVCLLMAAAIGVTAAAQQPGPPAPVKPDTPEITAMIEQVRKAAGPRWAEAVHFWCEAPRANRPDDPVIPPTRIFDNVYAIGNSGTTVYVIRTSAGLLMIDALGAGDNDATMAQLTSQLLPGFEKLGLDPAQVKIVLVTHGHADHYGGSAYFQEHFGSKVYVSAADWNVMEQPPGRGRGGRGPSGPPTPLPKHDAEIVDGTPIVLGDLKVVPIAVPGHTPGSMGFIFPVKDQGKSHTAALFGGAWLTPQILSDEALRTFLASVGRFKAATERAGVDVILQNHMLMDPIQPKLDAIATRGKNGANPFVVGKAEYQKFVGVMEGCTRVNLARRAL